MSGTALATSLLGRRVRLAAAPAGQKAGEGAIVTVYLDAEGMHYVVLVDGRLVNVAAGDQLIVLEESEW